MLVGGRHHKVVGKIADFSSGTATTVALATGWSLSLHRFIFFDDYAFDRATLRAHHQFDRCRTGGGEAGGDIASADSDGFQVESLAVAAAIAWTM